MDARAPTMEPTPPPPSEIGQDEDMISALPDELLLEILERLDVPEAVRAGALSRRWRHLPHQLSRLDLDVENFKGTTMLETMDAFTGAVCTLLTACPPPAESTECKCDSGTRRAVKILRLCFHPSSAPDLGSIGHAVEDIVSRGETHRFEFEVIPHSSDELIAEVDDTDDDDDDDDDWCTVLGQQFMSFSRTFPIAFRWLTGLSLTLLNFGDSDLPSLLGACDRLKHLSLESCDLVGQSSVLKIDLPNSIITNLDLINVGTQIELVSLPKLTQVLCCSWRSENPPLRFGYVPELRMLNLLAHAKAWQSPFALNHCFDSMSARNLSRLFLNFSSQMIWIQPERPRQLTAIFRKLTFVMLSRIFPDCDLNWTLSFLEVAPALKTFTLKRARHSCVETDDDSAEKTNVVWEPSKDLKHKNLQYLWLMGFEDEDKVANYIKLVMERATRLKMIKLYSTHTCDACDKIDPETLKRSQVDQASRRRIKERLTSGPSSSVKIILDRWR